VASNLKDRDNPVARLYRVMALSLERLRHRIITSIHGRHIGLDEEDRLCGIKGRRETITEGTSATASSVNLPNYGWVVITSSNDSTWTMDAPETGCEVKIVTGSTSTSEHYIDMEGATIQSCFGSTQNQIDLRGGGAGVTMFGLSTSQWKILQKSSTTAVLVTS